MATTYNDLTLDIRRRLRMDRGEAGGNVLAEELCKE